jgi:hypothetical protein
VTEVTEKDRQPIPFAFAGRVSTEDNASRNWQLSRARALIEPAGGIIVAEYFDIGQFRSLPWSRRPRAAELLEALADLPPALNSAAALRIRLAALACGPLPAYFTHGCGHGPATMTGPLVGPLAQVVVRSQMTLLELSACQARLWPWR